MNRKDFFKIGWTQKIYFQKSFSNVGKNNWTFIIMLIFSKKPFLATWQLRKKNFFWVNCRNCHIAKNSYENILLI
jgi:hypothetical protein